jgi:GNAT superfamily N-acetyltransferase
MIERSPIPLSAVPIRLDSPEFGIVSSWPYADPFVSRMLQTDIPERFLSGDCQIWVYRDPDGQLVGFGVLDIEEYYKAYTSAKPHPYIVLLAVNPSIKSLGYGTVIVRHLIAEAAVLASDPIRCCSRLFLDVYVNNVKGMTLYAACGFVPVEDEPIPDPLEGGKLYSVMSRLVAVEPTRVGH